MLSHESSLSSSAAQLSSGLSFGGATCLPDVDAADCRAVPPVDEAAEAVAGGLLL